MRVFIDEHREAHGVEPICRVLCRSPHRDTGAMPRSGAIQRGVARALGVTKR